ncbi:C-terminal binding protein [Brucella sp. LJL56]
MKIVKCDGVLTVEPEQYAYLAGLDATFIEKTLLNEDDLIEHCYDADALMILREPVTERVVKALPKLKVIGRFGVGLDSIDVEACTRAGVQVTYVPDSNLDEVSTHAVAMMLALARRLKRYDTAVRAGRWQAMVEGEGIIRPSHQKLGLIGFGQISRMTARKAAAFGYKVIAYDPYMVPESIAATGVEAATFEEVITQSDIVSLHVPATPETQNIISKDVLARMKKGAILINVSRGGLVDEGALANALKSAHLSGAGIDTLVQEPPRPDNPLLRVENLLLSPHAAHYSKQSYAEVRNKVFADVAAVLRNQTPKYGINSVHKET